MTYMTTDLITRSFYLSQVVGKEFQTVSGDQISDGLELLNDVITDKTIENELIPYYTNLSFTALTGVSDYYLADLIAPSTITFFIDGVRYQMIKAPRNNFFGSPRAMNIESLPFTFHFERELGGARVYLYFIPYQDFEMELWGQFRLSEVALGQDLSLTLDRFYLSYLKYELAQRICDEYNYTVPENVARRLQAYRAKIENQSALLDMSQNTVTTLDDKAGSINYGMVNLSGGWTVP